MHTHPPVAARLPYIPSSSDYANRKAKQFCKHFPSVSLGKSREGVARALDFKDWHALEAAVTGTPYGLTDDLLSPEERRMRLAWQASVIAGYLKLDLRQVRAFMEVWNLSGPSRGGDPNPQQVSLESTSMIRALRQVGAAGGGFSALSSPSVREALFRYTRGVLDDNHAAGRETQLEALVWEDAELAKGVSMFEQLAFELPLHDAGADAGEEQDAQETLPLVLSFAISHPASMPRTVTLTRGQQLELEGQVRACVKVPCLVANTGVVFQRHLGTDMPTEILRRLFQQPDVPVHASNAGFTEQVSQGYLLVGIVLRIPVSRSGRSDRAQMIHALRGLEYRLTVASLSHASLRYAGAGEPLAWMTRAGLREGASQPELDNVFSRAAEQGETVTLTRVAPELPLVGEFGYDIHVSMGERSGTGLSQEVGKGPGRQAAGDARGVTLSTGGRPLRMIAGLMSFAQQHNVRVRLSPQAAPARLSGSALVEARAQRFVRELGTTHWEHQPADTGVLADLWLSLVSSPLSLTYVHDFCLRHESLCVGYAGFLDSLLSVAALRDASETRRSTFALTIRGWTRHLDFQRMLPDSDRAALQHMLSTEFGVESAKLSPLALTPFFGVPFPGETLAVDACAWLKGVPQQQERRASALLGEEQVSPYATLIVFLSVADEDVSRVTTLMKTGANRATAGIESLTDFTAAHGSPAVLTTPVDALTRTGFSYIEGYNMLEHFLEFEEVESVNIAITWVFDDPLRVQLYVLDVEARRPGGALTRGSLKGMMPALYVSRIQARCLEWNASLHVTYHRSEDTSEAKSASVAERAHAYQSKRQGQEKREV